MQTGREFAQAPGGGGGGVIASLLGTIICFIASGALAGGSLKFPSSQLEPVKWSELAGWTADDHLAAFAAYQTSCQALLKIRRTDERGELSVALSNVCRRAANLQPQELETARAFFEQSFQPVRIGRLGDAEGLLPGYFEPIVAGSRFPTPEFHVPLYRRPRDLVAAGYKPGSAAFPNKGVRIARRNENNELVPYHDRGAIEAGALDGQRLEICWLRDPFDLLALQLEGSGRVILEDGTPFFIEADLPIERRKPASPFHRLMIAQDTGSAIVGPARADLYWGAGEEAGRIAGRIRHAGRFVMLLPREIDIAAAGREPPLPVPKPKIATLDAGKKGEGRVESAGSGAAAVETPSPPRRPSIVAREAKKRDDKGKADSANAGVNASS